MTDTATVAPATESTAPEPTLDDVLENADEFVRSTVTMYRDWVTEYNQLAAREAALGSDPQALLESLRENPPSDLPEEAQAAAAKIEKAKTFIFELEQELDVFLKERVTALRANSEDERTVIKAKLEELNGSIKPARMLLKKLPGAPKNLEGLLPKQASARKASGKSGGTGVRRIRGRKWTVGVGENSQTFDGTTPAAAHLKADTSALQSAFFTAAGSDNKDKWPDSVTFEFKGHTVTVTKAE